MPSLRHCDRRESLTPHPPIAQRGAEALAAEEEGGLGAAPWNGASSCRTQTCWAF